MARYEQVAFTATVRQVQEKQGSRQANNLLVGIDTGRPDPLTDAEAKFIAQRDGFYLASVSETGWPYAQYRGGPPGFVHVLDQGTLAYADVRGNRQYLTNSNIRADDRVSLFLMDYARRIRLKVFGHAYTLELDEDDALTQRVCGLRTDGRVERVMVIRIEGYSWNCPQHITRRFSTDELSAIFEQIREFERKNHLLERENTALHTGSGVP